jgi:hypothetical protein
VRSKVARNKSAARVISSSASSKKILSPDSPCFSALRIAPSYASLFLIAWSKIVGFDVRPVTDISSM